MKRILILLLAMASVSLSAQTVPDNALSRSIREFPQRAGNNLHSYEFQPLYDTPAPKGYKPFYISHYGRHGSRTNGNGDGKSYEKLEKILTKARADGQLTADGELLLSVTRRVIGQFNGMGGRLTARGCREHARLAERMYHRYPEVFKKGSRKICAVSSTVPRCIVSMAAFTNRLMSIQKDLEIGMDTGEKYMAYIAQGDTKEIRAMTKPLLDSLHKGMPLDTAAIMATLFKDPAAAREYVHSVKKFERYVYNVAQATEALDIKENIYGLLPESVVYRWSESNSMYIYLNHGNSAEVGDIRVPRAASLVEDIISRADEVIAGTPRAADLRFGHDWPFLGLVCYLGLEGVSDRMTLDEAHGQWVAALYTPFAANLQMIFYRNKRQDILVKFLLNEKETLISELAPVQGPYYRWEDVKHHVREEWN